MLRRTILGSVTWLLALPALGQPLGTDFTYQGRLTDAGAPANGIYDLQFALFNAATGGTQFGALISRNDLTVTDGLFTVTLDFGAAAFTGSSRWLEIGVRAGASTGAFTALSPRQELTATPNALYSRAAGTATTVSGIVGVASGGTGANLSATGGSGQYVKQANAGAALSVGAIPAADLPPHTHSAADLVSGILPEARGGTGQTAYSVNGVVYASGGGNLVSTPPGATGQVLVGSTGGVPAWSTSTGITALGTLGSLSVSGTATLGGLSCAGCVGTPALQDASATSPKLNPTVLGVEAAATNYAFDDTPVNNVRVCALGPYTASTNQRALLDAGMAWQLLLSTTGSVQVLYSTNGGAAWTAAFAQPFWSTNVTNGWGNSSRSAALSLNAGVTYLFAVTGWGTLSFTALDTRCFLRVVVVAR